MSGILTIEEDYVRRILSCRLQRELASEKGRDFMAFLAKNVYQ